MDASKNTYDIMHDIFRLSYYESIDRIFATEMPKI